MSENNGIVVGYKNGKMIGKKGIVIIREKKSKGDEIVIKIKYDSENKIELIKISV
jgi:hypothetical protein